MIQQAKPLPQQIAERKQRAHEQYESYTIRRGAITGRTQDGQPLRAVVYYVSPRNVPAGKPTPVYTVTRTGCCCGDSIQARKAELTERYCKHYWMVQEFHARTQRALVDEGEITEVSHPDMAAEPEINETLVRAEKRAERNRRMEQDFGAE